MSEAIQPVSNPVLKQAMERMHRGENGREEQMVTLQLLLRAQLLAPVQVIHYKGKEPQIRFCLLETRDGRDFLPAFTDLKELRKCFPDREQQTLVVTFADYAKMILADGAAAGLAVDPMGDSLVLEKPLIEFLSRVEKQQETEKSPGQ